MELPNLPYTNVILNKSDDELPNVSILMPCWRRRKFIPLIIANINNLDYPKDKLELCILQDGDQDLFIDETRLHKFRNAIHPVRLTYRYEPNVRRTIGEKRNKLVKMASYKYLANMDSDDVYIDTYYTVHHVYCFRDKDEIRTHKKQICSLLPSPFSHLVLLYFRH